MSYPIDPARFEEEVKREQIADMRRLLMKWHMTAIMTTSHRDVIECFLVDYERERGLRS